MSVKHKNIAYSELRSIVPSYLAGFGLIVLVCAVISFSQKSFDYRLYAGALIGSAVSLLNFYLLALTAVRITKSGLNQEKARFNANMGYGARYLGMFAVFAVCLILDIANIATLLIPLFFPKLYYTIKYGLKKPEKL